MESSVGGGPTDLAKRFQSAWSLTSIPLSDRYGKVNLRLTKSSAAKLEKVAEETAGRNRILIGSSLRLKVVTPLFHGLIQFVDTSC